MTSKKTQVQTIKPHLATLILIGIVLLGGLIVFLWAIGFGVITDIFNFLNLWQDNPPSWTEVPQVMGRFLLLPSVGIVMFVSLIIRLSPRPQVWSRFVVIATLLILTVYYLQWRSLATLNLSNPLQGTFSLALLLLELFVLFNSSLQLLLMVQVKDKQLERDRLAIAVTEGTFQPTVDIFIPTYDEPEFILRRTIIGCQAINYSAKTIYLLDDTQRRNIAQLAQELGCEYVTRPDNLHAKAGNINHALPLTKGELIAVFDADFVPTRNFLVRTVGLFQDEKLALVQTPQNFYNIDPIARNLGLEDVLTPEEEVFYRQLQPIKDAAGSVVCAGTSFVMRRVALEAIGGFVTDSLSEDYFTGIRLSSLGYRLAYIDEKLSAGLAAENIADHAKQRIRWARGTLQAFFINSNPLTIKGLSFIQRLAHLEGLLHWFSSWAVVFFLLMPLGYAFLGILPIRATTEEFLFFFLPYYLTRLTVFTWLNDRSRSAILSNIYGLVLAFPQAIAVTQVMFDPFGKGFNVTPKGTKSDRFNFNWQLASPLLVLFAFTGISLWLNIYGSIRAEMEISPTMPGVNIGWIWSIFNLLSLGGALLILLDVPKIELHEWFALRRLVKLEIATSDCQQVYWGATTKISEVGLEMSVAQAAIAQLPKLTTIPVSLTILEENIELIGQVVSIKFDGHFYQLRIDFTPLQLQQERLLIALLYCRPGQWKRRNSPGELYSLWLMFKILLRPQIIFNRRPKINTIEVSQI